jgi:hypothetical protein
VETGRPPWFDDWEAYRPPVSPADKHAELVADVRRTRRTFQVTSDDATVEEIARRIEAQDPDVDSGMCMTREELRAFNAAEAPYEDLDALHAYTEQFPEQYAGSMLGRDGPRRWFEARFTDDLDKHERALRALAPPGAEIRVGHAQYSTEALRQVGYAIYDAEEELAGIGLLIRGGERSELEGRIIVHGITPDPEGATALLRDRFGPMVDFEWLGTETEEIVDVEWGTYVEQTPTHLIVLYFTNAAYRPAGADVVETDDRVTITVHELRDVATAETLAGSSREAEVDLARPVGDRTVIDGADGTPRYRWKPQNG